MKKHSGLIRLWWCIKKAAQAASRRRNNSRVVQLNPRIRQVAVRKMSGVCRFQDSPLHHRGYTHTRSSKYFPFDQ